MIIWVDADACPAVIKETLYRAAKRTGIQLILVANRNIPTPSSPSISFIRVQSGQDVADNEIIQRMDKGDLVVTADIPLAAAVIAKGGAALNPRGEMYEADSVRSRLSMRDFMNELRANGIDTGGPATLKPCDRKAFADRLDAFLAGTSKRK